MSAIEISGFSEGFNSVADRCKVLVGSLQVPITIGIAGGSASGKTIFAKKLIEHLSASVATLSMDDYYHPQEYRDEHNIFDFDKPEVFDLSLFSIHLRELLRGNGVSSPVYSFRDGGRTGDMRPVESAPVIIADGLFTLLPELGFSFHISVFVKTSKQEMLSRRLARDVERTSQTPEQIARMFVEEVYPVYKKHVQPSAEYADIVIHNDWTSPKDTSYSGEVLEWILKLAEL